MFQGSANSKTAWSDFVFFRLPLQVSVLQVGTCFACLFISYRSGSLPGHYNSLTSLNLFIMGRKHKRILQLLIHIH